MDVLVYLIKCCNIKLPQSDTAVLLQRISVLEEKILNHECDSVHKEDSNKIELNDNIVNDSDDSFHTGSDMYENPFTVDTETFENEQAGLVPAQDVKEDTDDGIDDYILSLLGGHL